MTSPDRWIAIVRVLDVALDLAPEARAAYVTNECGGDAALREQVLELLEACSRAEASEDLLASPALQFAGPVLADLAAPDTELPALAAELQAAVAGRYLVERELGRGGMATVFLARDLRHDRAVAVKVLARDLVVPSGVDRFLREIRLTARLSHPHLLPVHESGEADGLLYYVMPYAEGETLRTRLAREGALPLADAIRLLRELADALAFAHARGVVHRDLKPENILLSGGHAVVADFGIAKALAAAAEVGLPLAASATASGVLGTPAYMAPEQAAGGADIDHRADLYALGVVAFEMIAGVHPFGARSPQALVTAHLTEVPAPLGDLRPDVPPALAALVGQCLAKAPAERPASAEAVLAVLVEAEHDADGTRTGRSRRVMRLATLTGVAAVALAAVAVLNFRGEPRIEFGPVRSLTRDPGIELHPALSPDGTLLAYVAGPVGGMKLYLRETAGGNPIELAKDLPGNQAYPSWSPDGARILFRSGCRFYLVPKQGGIPVEVRARAEECPDGFWTAGVWSPSGGAIAWFEFDTLYTGPVTGGVARRLGVIQEGHSPAWSPDGKWIAAVSGNRVFANGSGSLGNMAAGALVLVPAAGGAPAALTDRQNFNTSPVWLPDSRHLVYMSTEGAGRDLHLMRIDAGGRPAGTPARLTAGLDVATLAISADGKTLAYTALDVTSNIWAIDIPAPGMVASASGARQVTRGTDYVEVVVVSPDGEWLAFDSDRAGNSDIYVISRSGGEPRRISTDPGFEFDPDWSPDGKEIAYQSSRSGSRDVYVIGVDGRGDQLVAGGPARDSDPQWAPDGRSIAFLSDRTGDFELFLTERRPDGTWGAPRQITTDHGETPSWSPDGTLILHYCGSRTHCVIRPDGSGRRVVLEARRFPDYVHTVTGVSWSRDGRAIHAMAFDRSGRASYWKLPATGGTPRQIVRFDDPDRQPLRNQYADDGKRFYFTMARRESDIKAMEIRWTR